jgi:predicted Fe-Mo cluster-binding NifX family protein
MKVIITATSADIDAHVDARFGRASYFIVVDADSLEWQAIANPAIHASGGAGIQAAQFIADQGCDAVVSGEFGPNAYNALKTAGLPMYLLGSCRTAREVIQQMNQGQLERMNSPAGGRGRGRDTR